jgi:L-rhamnose isomerase
VLDHFQIETPSWGFADTGTRFGKFLQDAAAIDFKDKLADSGEIPYMIDRSHNRQAEDRGDASNRGSLLQSLAL